MNATGIATAAALALSALTASAGEAVLPEGRGKQLVEANCLQCHELGRITSAGYSEQGWRNNISMMLNVGSSVPANQIDELVQYLAKNFPEKPRPKAVLVQGDHNIAIAEWLVPTPGSRPHDPLATADGAIWYTGQFANLLGRRDPKTGQIKEYPLGPNTGPHGLIADRAGNIWYAANFGAHIGRLDPASGRVTKYPMPDPKVKDVHTLIWGRNDLLYFTAQNANVVGRLNPRTGEIKLVASPTKGSRPYGLAVTSRGTPYYVEFGTNKLASIDPETLAIKEYELPHKDSRPRRLAIGSDDVIWLADFSRGYLGRFDPATGKYAEYPSPSGPHSQPYGIAVIDDIVWYNESGTDPNTIVRFDPKTEKFQSWAVPSGGGVIRNVSVTADGNLAIAQSGVNRIGLVTVK